jgi:Arc/MetJ family transcription regulator
MTSDARTTSSYSFVAEWCATIALVVAIPRRNLGDKLFERIGRPVRSDHDDAVVDRHVNPMAQPVFDAIHTILRTLHIMRTNIDIDDGLMRQAMRTSGARTKRAAVEEGLRLLIRTRGQRSIRRLRGKVAWDGDLEESRRSRIVK